MSGLAVSAAAAALGVPPGTLRRWVREGCPAVTHGRRGRGCALTVDPQAVLQWRQAMTGDRIRIEVAAAIPGLLADAAVESWQRAEGVNKRQLAGIFAAHWYVGTNVVLDHLRDQCPDVPELAALPESIERLRKIASG